VPVTFGFNPVTATLTVTGTAGTDDDKLSFEVDLSGVLKAASAAEIDGGAGIDACHAAGFITGVFNCEKTF
jgi:hypothetical protein